MKKLSNLFLIFLFLGFASCDILKQTSEMSRLTKCEFRLESVQNMTLGGVNIQDKKSYSDLNLMDIARIGSVMAGGTLPLNFTLNVQGRNPNQGLAAMNRFEWILYIDDIEMTSGVLNNRVEIPPNSGTTIIPLGISIDLMKALSGKSGNALLNFAFNLTGHGTAPSRVMLKAKPTIMVKGRAVEYPGYIRIKQDFSSS